MKEVVIAAPGDLATATGGFGYDRRIVAELAHLGWKSRVLNLGSGFPEPTQQTRERAAAQLSALPRQSLVVIDGLAFGAMPETAKVLSQVQRLVALVHHPLALESGLEAATAAALRASELAALTCARHVIASSRTTMRILAEDFRVPVERLSVVEPGTDRVALRPRNRAGTIRLLSVGAVIPRKGYDILVTALAKLRDLPWRLVVVGDCTRDVRTAEQLRAQISQERLTDRITLSGVVSADELSSLYGRSDLFVLPSRFEGYGMAFTEAIAHGLPVVGTRAGAISQTVPNEAGVLVRPDDPQALAGALQHLIADHDQRERLAARARAVVFPSWRQQGARFARVLESVR